MNLLDLNILVPFMRKRNHRRAARRPKTQRRVRAVILPKKQKSKNKTTICERVQPNWVFSWTEYHSLLFLQTSIPKEDILEEKGIGKEAMDFVHEPERGIFPYDRSPGFFGNNQHLPFHLGVIISFTSPSSTPIKYTRFLTQGLKFICSFQSIPKGVERGEGRGLQGQQSLSFSKSPSWIELRKERESAVLQRPTRERVANTPMGSYRRQPAILAVEGV